jgi:hypothetical protein
MSETDDRGRLMPRLLYIGNVGPESPAHSTENEYVRAFETLGWDVRCVNERAMIEHLADDRTGWLWAAALESDLVIYTLTQGLFGNQASLVHLWKACERAGIPTAAVHLDLFYGLSSPKGARGPQRCELPALHPMFRMAHVFTPDGWHDNEWARDGVNHHWLPPGVSHTECVDVDLVEPGVVELPADVFRRLLDREYLVGFAGSDGYHDEWPHRAELVAWLRETYGDRFLHIGGSATPRVTGLALNRVLASVPVWVGDSCHTAPDRAYWSDRVPETWGRGGFLIHPHVDALAEHYSHYHLPGSRWAAGDWDALRSEIELYLDPPGFTRDELRSRLAAHTRAHDTYLHRAQTIIDTCWPETLTIDHDEIGEQSSIRGGW